MRFLRQRRRWAGLFFLVGAIGAPSAGWAAACPPALASLSVVLEPPAGALSSEVLVSGTLVEASCDSSGKAAASYNRVVACNPGATASCRIEVTALQPGLWLHTVLGLEGEASGQQQAQRALLLAASAGDQFVSWPLFRSLATVTTLRDRNRCTGCLRDALEHAADAPKPHLIQFAPDLTGTIELVAQLPVITADEITLDARARDGLPLQRTIDAAGLGHAALRITGSHNRVIGLRLVGVGGNSDTLLIDGANANGNVVQAVQVIGRAIASCAASSRGCVVDGLCRAQDETPEGFCGDDGIAVRDDAGALEVNSIVDADVSGAFDKGIKSSEGGSVVVRRSHLHDNADGGAQATLGGRIEVIESISENNAGTASANGIAANGARLDGSDAAQLRTRGNVVRHNALRGISVRSLSAASLRDDFVCGNGTASDSDGFGLALLAAAGASPQVEARGLALVANAAGGVVIADSARADLGSLVSPGRNLFAFNGPSHPITPVQVRNLGDVAASASGNFWESCGRSTHCDESRVRGLDVFAPGAAVDISPAEASVQRRTAHIDSVEPTQAAAGDLVWVYGSGFDAVAGNGRDGDCAAIAQWNTCPPERGTCVFVDDAAAQVVAVTPTMLVLRAPFTCVEPVVLAVRTRGARGFARAPFCVAAPPETR